MSLTVDFSKVGRIEKLHQMRMELLEDRGEVGGGAW